VGPTLDRRASTVLEQLRRASLVFDLAQTPADRDAVLRIRRRTVVEEGWARPEDHPDGRERDEFDREAVFVVCRNPEAIVGSMRILMPSPQRILPIEREFGIRARPVGQVFEVGRVIVDPAVRGQSHLILGGLSARGWMEAHAHGYERAVAAATPEVIDVYRAVGLRVTILGPARLHWGLRRAPVQVEGDRDSFSFLPG
jgi:N-acyl-L-homoserine lactone synthetase